MKLNNKGVTIIEIIVSVSLISIVLIFLLRLLITLREIDDKSLSKLEYEEKTSLIIKAVQDDIKDLKECNITSSEDLLNIECSEVRLKLERNSDTSNPTITLSYDDGTSKSWTFPKGAELGNISLSNNSNLYIATLNVKDDKGNIYPIEISYLKK